MWGQKPESNAPVFLFLHSGSKSLCAFSGVRATLLDWLPVEVEKDTVELLLAQFINPECCHVIWKMRSCQTKIRDISKKGKQSSVKREICSSIKLVSFQIMFRLDLDLRKCWFSTIWTPIILLVTWRENYMKSDLNRESSSGFTQNSNSDLMRTCF